MDQERLSNHDLEQLVRGEIQRWTTEHERRDTERFDQIRAGQVKIQSAVEEMNGKVGRMNAEIGFGLPEPDQRGDRPTLRARLHELENTKHAATAAGAALGLLFGRITRWAMVIGIVIAAVGTVLRLFGVGG